MSLRAQLTDAMKEAMKAKDAKRLSTLRLILAGLKDRDIAARTSGNSSSMSMLPRASNRRAAVSPTVVLRHRSLNHCSCSALPPGMKREVKT